ncbi:MAG TPA: hypothetical protein VFE18_20185 [Phenylobacterium sp.]|jgi:hypothetical protein|uniref:DUF7662 domain-containing protein n=1 Tax=Phenylobacterium sp. TaxID=1871053 RepID=UPI002D6C5F6C|nr:hypothetical protein [Phenylobacterium sp.]HZZ70497.1 hypothetical protein [Phenylobacterium sp.]
MSRYDPLGTFLKQQPAERVPISFGEIEGILGVSLPRSKRYPAWWSNNPSNNPMTKVWLEAGFVTEQVNPEAGRLTFRRIRAGGKAAARGDGAAWLGRLRAKMAGSVQVQPGWDLTNPTGEVWDAERE